MTAADSGCGSRSRKGASGRLRLRRCFVGSLTEASGMSTFYILPSRSLLGQRFAEFLASVFPGLDWQRPEWRDLAETLGADVLRQSDVYVVYREDLPEGAP